MVDIQYVLNKQRKADSKLARKLLPLCYFRPTRKLALIIITYLEGGSFWSTNLRKFLKERHQVEVGYCTYGPCLVPGKTPRGTKIGNYCSIAKGINIFRRNHPTDRISQSAIFFNESLGLVLHDTIEKDEDNPLEIGHDVWIGHGTTITPSCKTIGDGAIIAAGSIVTKDIPPFSIFAGSPAKFLRDRFPPETRNLVERSKWWNNTLTNLPLTSPLFFEAIDQDGAKQLCKTCSNPVEPDEC